MEHDPGLEPQPVSAAKRSPVETLVENERSENEKDASSEDIAEGQLPYTDLIYETKSHPGLQILTLPLSDSSHPNNWSFKKKLFIVSIGFLTTFHSTLGSSLPSNAIQYIAREFHVTSEVQLILPISIFLAGYVFGSTTCGPISEAFGRKDTMVISFIVYILFTMACALASSWWSFLLFRFICGLSASAPIACVSGIFADINSDPRARGVTMACFIAFTAAGPPLSGALSGFVSENTTWRWVFGVATIFAATTLPFVLALPETYAPVLLHRNAVRLRKKTGDESIIAQSDLQEKTFNYIMSVVMMRPLKMLFQELIVSTTCIYIGLCYGVYYLNFESYVIIFQGPESVYKFSPGLAGLALLPIGIGAIMAVGILLLWDIYLARSQAAKKPWSLREESRRLPLALLGGPLFAISIFWLGWSSQPGIYWLVPVLSGIFFGMSFLLIMMAMLNYLSDAYMTYAASAQGIASTCRSSLGVLLPLAAPRMFKDLGVARALTVLGSLAIAFAAIPWLFIIYGERIRAGSKFCQELKRLHEKELADKLKFEEHRKNSMEIQKVWMDR